MANLHDTVRRRLPEATYIDQVWDEVSFNYKGDILRLSYLDYDVDGAYDEEIDKFLRKREEDLLKRLNY